jgi:hypothetical protein
MWKVQAALVIYLVVLLQVLPAICNTEAWLTAAAEYFKLYATESPY